MKGIEIRLIPLTSVAFEVILSLPLLFHHIPRSVYIITLQLLSINCCC